MKFESKMGIGEIVMFGSKALSRAANTGISEDAKVCDGLAEVIAVTFEKGGRPKYTVRIATQQHVSIQTFFEDELVGDPDFDQRLGIYPPEPFEQDITEDMQ